MYINIFLILIHVVNKSGNAIYKNVSKLFLSFKVHLKSDFIKTLNPT